MVTCVVTFKQQNINNFLNSSLMGSKGTCCVLNCNNMRDKTRNISFHEIPSNLNMRVLWFQQLEPVMKPTIRSDLIYVCGIHFEEECFKHSLKRKILKWDAIPTKFNLVSINCERDNELKLIDEQPSILNVPNLETHIFDENRTKDILHLTDDSQSNHQPHLPILLNDVTIKEEQCEEEILEPGLMVVEFSNEERNQYIYNSVKFHTKDGKTDVCRICLKPTFDNIKLISQDQTKTVGYKDMVQFVLPDMKLDFYPDPQMCVSCETLLIQAYEFKKKSMLTEEGLYKHVKKITYTNCAINIIIHPKVINKHEINVVSGKGKKTRSRKDHYEAKSETVMDITNKIQDTILEDDNTKKSNPDNNSRIKEPFVQKQKRKLIPTMMDDLFDEKFDNYFSRLNSRVPLLNDLLTKRSRNIWGEPPFLCDTCGQMFPRLKQYRRHVNMHRIKKEIVESFTCEICNLTFRNVNISQHYLTHHKRKHCKCEICHRQFDYRHVKMLHIKTAHAKEENAQCHVCGAIMKRSSIPIHLFKHNPNNKKYKCHICNNNRTYFKTSFAVHLKAHREPAKERVCYICGKILTSNIKKHIETVHENKKRGIYNCDICNKAYTLKSYLKNHFIKEHVRTSEKLMNNDTAMVLSEHTYALKEMLTVTSQGVLHTSRD